MSQRRVGLIVAALALVAVAVPLSANAQQAAAYTNPMDQQSDVANWYLYDYYGWWAVDATPIEGHNSPASLNINNGSDIDGDYNYPSLQSEVINVAGLDNPILSFWCLNDLPDPNQYYSYQYFYIYDGNYNYGWGWQFGPNMEMDCGNSGDWHQHLVPLPPEIVQAGSLRINSDLGWEVWYQGAGMQGWFFDQLQILVPDITPPDSVTNLAASGATLTSIQLDWSAPFDDDMSGVTASYDLRFSTTPITGTSFNSATQVNGEPTPDVEGTPHSVVITNLTEDTTYYFALQVTDIAGNVSAISNVASLATLTPPPPPPPPTANVAPLDIKEPPKDILPCSAGTTAAPLGLAGLAGVILLAFMLRRKI